MHRAEQETCFIPECLLQVPRTIYSISNWERPVKRELLQPSIDAAGFIPGTLQGTRHARDLRVALAVRQHDREPKAPWNYQLEQVCSALDSKHFFCVSEDVVWHAREL